MSSAATPPRDVFISHAYEDKAAVVDPLKRELERRNVTVWVDDYELLVGQSLRREIDKALATCRYGAVVISEHFFAKEWPQKELDALTQRQVVEKRALILPVWHRISARDIRRFSPMLADTYGISTDHGIRAVAEAIVSAISLVTTEPVPRAPVPVVRVPPPHEAPCPKCGATTIIGPSGAGVCESCGLVFSAL